MSFESKQFQFKDLRLNLSGRSLVGFREIKYSVNVDKQPSYARGNKVMSIQHGNESIEGQISILQSELEALTRAVKEINPNSKITDYDYDCVVSYGVGDRLVTDIILGLSFTKYEKGMEQGDVEMVIEMPFLAREVLEQQ